MALNQVSNIQTTPSNSGGGGLGSIIGGILMAAAAIPTGGATLPFIAPAMAAGGAVG
jgi:hypothetical protein